ncbi:MAG: ABC transporter substrate-binding protein, partial [Rhodospirillaceae bacterium]|nr:ABC transporter substrate-binding protein [Rhodospirillaceae bacterium]
MTPYRRWIAGAALAAISLAGAGSATRAQPHIEPPWLKPKIATGVLPPIALRLPATPSVVSYTGTAKKPGRYGGSLTMLMARAKDTRMAVVYGYARLVAYDSAYRLRPDILERFEVKDGRIFTFTLRKGHRWSD